MNSTALKSLQPLNLANLHSGAGRDVETYAVEEFERHLQQYLWLAPARIVGGPRAGQYRFVGQQADTLRVVPAGWCTCSICDAHPTMEEAAHHFRSFLLARCLEFHAPGPGRLRRCQHCGQKTTGYALVEYDYFRRIIPLCAEHHTPEVVATCFGVEDL